MGTHPEEEQAPCCRPATRQALGTEDAGRAAGPRRPCSRRTRRPPCNASYATTPCPPSCWRDRRGPPCPAAASSC